MRGRQRLALIVGFVMILAMLLFPPWLFVLDRPATSESSSLFGDRRSSSRGHEHVERSGGYHFLLGQHIPQDKPQLEVLFATDVDLEYVTMKIDSTRLVIQLGVTLLIVGFAMLLSRKTAT